jgi:thymidylate synthase (FAD)
MSASDNPGNSEIGAAPRDTAEPTLRTVSRPSFAFEEIDDLLTAEDTNWNRTAGATDAENLIEAAGRLCYMSFGERQSPKTNSEYIRHLIAHGHESVLEHASWSFILTGVSRGFSHQIVRHRVGFAFSQLSQQYRDQSDAPAMMPEVLQRYPAIAERWEHAVETSQLAYREILAALDSCPPQELPPREQVRLLRTAARSVLPAATETKLLFTANARALRHFLRVRGTIEGDEEMRVVSALILSTMRTEAPSVFTDFSLEQLSDGLPVIRHAPYGG